MPTRDGHWPHDLEGSYAPVPELASLDHIGRPWLSNDHGYRTLERDDHCNRGYTRWILREHGITLAGPAPRFIPRRGARRLSAPRGGCLAAYPARRPRHLDRHRRPLAWGQRYAVVAACRIYYTLRTAEVATKLAALEWAVRTLHPRWRPLLGQVRDGRSLGWDPAHRPRPGEADAARALVAYVITQADRADVIGRND